jgi:alkanesulfonate monooxygenase SsuD/methylene tetrahydromethanopterin reductase-like flavin-dependent oxidoreductase (luciferase family)
MSSPITPTDLTRRPPRSVRVRLGGFVILARMLDKGRALLAKKNGQYNYNSLTDQHLVRFLGFDPEALLQELAAGKGDGEILQWVLTNAKTSRSPWEIQTWSAYFDNRGPDSDAETLTGFAEYVGQHSKTREDIKTWFDALDLDDFVSFGGNA